MKVTTLQEKVIFLQQKGAGITEHSKSSLLDHLLGTYSLLRTWGARAALCDAGLFHSVYGTESFKPVMISQEFRVSVQEIIGVEAETLVYLFSYKKSVDLFTHAQEKAAQLRNRNSDSVAFCNEIFRMRNRLTFEWMPFTFDQLLDLVSLTIANALEQATRLPDEYGREDLIFLQDISPLALPAAQKTLDAILI
jgi:hypothetical protein